MVTANQENRYKVFNSRHFRYRTLCDTLIRRRKATSCIERIEPCSGRTPETTPSTSELVILASRPRQKRSQVPAARWRAPSRTNHQAFSSKRPKCITHFTSNRLKAQKKLDYKILHRKRAKCPDESSDMAE